MSNHTPGLSQAIPGSSPSVIRRLQPGSSLPVRRSANPFVVSRPGVPESPCRTTPNLSSHPRLFVQSCVGAASRTRPSSGRPATPQHRAASSPVSPGRRSSPVSEETFAKRRLELEGVTTLHPLLGERQTRPSSAEFGEGSSAQPASGFAKVRGLSWVTSLTQISYSSAKACRVFTGPLRGAAGSAVFGRSR